MLNIVRAALRPAADSFRAWLLAPVLSHLEVLVTTAADRLAAEIDAETNRLATVFDGLATALRDALAEDNVDVIRERVEAEISNRVEPAIDRLRSVGADPANPVPDPTPEPDPTPPASDNTAPDAGDSFENGTGNDDGTFVEPPVTDTDGDEDSRARKR